MVRAPQPLGVAGLTVVEDRVTAVLADGRQHPDDTVLAAGHDQRLGADGEGVIVTGLGDLADVAEAQSHSLVKMESHSNSKNSSDV